MQTSDKQLVPTRTLIVTGFKDEEECKKFKDSLSSNDKIFEAYTIPNTNFLFLMFYDLRESMKFKNAFSNESLTIKYTISKYEIPKKTEECSQENMQSTVNFIFNDIEMNIEDTFIAGFLKQYGEIKEIKISRPQQKTVEFYDFRSAKKAFETLNDSLFGTGSVKCKWMWDMSLQPRTEYLKQTDDLLRQLALNKRPDPQVLDHEAKKLKITGSHSSNSGFLELFDNFIFENISNIERILKPK